MSKVFVTRKIPGKGIELLAQKGYQVEIGPLKKVLAGQAKGSDALLCLLTDKIDGTAMDRIGPQLKVISNYAVGLDNIDIEAAKQRNITVTNTPDVLTEAVAEHAVALVLAIARRLAEADRFVRAGKYKQWEPELLLGEELKGKIFGLVGHGRIGCRVADILQKGFGMNVMYSDAVRDEKREAACGITYALLYDLLGKADVVSLHVPLLPTTMHLIGEKELSLMKPTALLVNTSRGPIINEKALVKALKEKQIKGAALDVFENEPKLMPGLPKLENVILTPHIASATREAREKMGEVAAQNIISVLSNKQN